MKNLLTVVMLFVFSTALYAQKDVTKFLGIPVDGTKTAMIQKLKAKGFQYNSSGDYLTGEFNGRDVRISVVTNNNKVYRIMVVDDNNSDETSIKIRFNTLCRQFENNKKYIPLGDYTLSEEEDISYEMTVNNKRYEAVYYQQPEITDSTAFVKEAIGQSLGRDKTRNSGCRIVIYDGFIFKKDGLVYDWRIRQGILHRYVL